ncbi:hypothetical protein E2C01_093429 [Portunus trituberculatus]|uniref:Uncharacterized protein n=1 Tax=Portunus trituberculatus TaxID=210409 RepID=A0A5B7JYR6_PORTR|nr:hypothetical protein [Portunus trituberculatus]
MGKQILVTLTHVIRLITLKSNSTNCFRIEIWISHIIIRVISIGWNHRLKFPMSDPKECCWIHIVACESKFAMNNKHY